MSTPQGASFSTVARSLAPIAAHRNKVRKEVEQYFDNTEAAFVQVDYSGQLLARDAPAGQLHTVYRFPSTAWIGRLVDLVAFYTASTIINHSLNPPPSYLFLPGDAVEFSFGGVAPPGGTVEKWMGKLASRIASMFNSDVFVGRSHSVSSGSSTGFMFFFNGSTVGEIVSRALFVRTLAYIYEQLQSQPDVSPLRLVDTFLAPLEHQIENSGLTNDMVVSEWQFAKERLTHRWRHKNAVVPPLGIPRTLPSAAPLAPPAPSLADPPPVPPTVAAAPAAPTASEQTPLSALSRPPLPTPSPPPDTSHATNPLKRSRADRSSSSSSVAQEKPKAVFSPSLATGHPMLKGKPVVASVNLTTAGLFPPVEGAVNALTTAVSPTVSQPSSGVIKSDLRASHFAMESPSTQKKSSKKVKEVIREETPSDRVFEHTELMELGPSAFMIKKILSNKDARGPQILGTHYPLSAMPIATFATVIPGDFPLDPSTPFRPLKDGTKLVNATVHNPKEDDAATQSRLAPLRHLIQAPGWKKSDVNRDNPYNFFVSCRVVFIDWYVATKGFFLFLTSSAMLELLKHPDALIHLVKSANKRIRENNRSNGIYDDLDRIVGAIVQEKPPRSYHCKGIFGVVNGKQAVLYSSGSANHGNYAQGYGTMPGKAPSDDTSFEIGVVMALPYGSLVLTDLLNRRQDLLLSMKRRNMLVDNSQLALDRNRTDLRVFAAIKALQEAKIAIGRKFFNSEQAKNDVKSVEEEELSVEEEVELLSVSLPSAPKEALKGTLRLRKDKVEEIVEVVCCCGEHDRRSLSASYFSKGSAAHPSTKAESYQGCSASVEIQQGTTGLILDMESEMYSDEYIERICMLFKSTWVSYDGLKLCGVLPFWYFSQPAGEIVSIESIAASVNNFITEHPHFFLANPIAQHLLKSTSSTNLQSFARTLQACLGSVLYKGSEKDRIQKGGRRKDADASLTMGRFDLLVGYRRGKADKNDRKKQKKKTIEPVMSTPTSFDVMDVDEQAGSSGRDEVPEVCEEEIEYNSEGEQE